jgi:signal transduction histidine kinase
MTRLYLRIYVAVIASLAVFALAAGFLWRNLSERPPQFEFAATLAQNALPPAAAPQAAQQAALERLTASLRGDATLYAADGSVLASVGTLLPVPERAGWSRGAGWAAHLPDGRWLVARSGQPRRGPVFGVLMLAVILLAVGVGAYPVVRRLTRRLERLQAGVESLGSGELSARVKVEGNDEVARLARSFNNAAERIEQLLGAHKALLANASHELRTPLARIRMAVELMKESADPKRKRELEQDIAELDALIEELLLASRLDAHGGALASETVDLLALAAEECARYPEAELDGAPVSVRGDARLLRRLIRNLLENARRHGAPPTELRVARVPRGAQIRVSDHGSGVPEALRERVFEPFFRTPGTGEATGAGLGLALVRQIARRHGGEARCEARTGGGSEFLVELPA